MVPALLSLFRCRSSSTASLQSASVVQIRDSKRKAKHAKSTLNSCLSKESRAKRGFDAVFLAFAVSLPRLDFSLSPAAALVTRACQLVPSTVSSCLAPCFMVRFLLRISKKPARKREGKSGEVQVIGSSGRKRRGGDFSLTHTIIHTHHHRVISLCRRRSLPPSLSLPPIERDERRGAGLPLCH